MATVKVKFRPSQWEGKEGTLYYQVIHKRVVRKIGTGYRLGRSEWNNGQLVFPSVESAAERHRYLSVLQRCLLKDTRRLHAIIQRLEKGGAAYTSEQVVDAYRLSDNDESWLCVFTGTIVRHLKRIGRERLSETYATSLNSFLRFRGIRGDIRFDEMDSDLMLEYETYLKGCGLVPNTTSFYMRNLRAIYNRAVEKGLVTDRMPFKHVYTGVEKTVKRAVSSEILRHIKNLDLSANASLELSRDLFMFSFYTRGMSFVDMAKLKKKDLQNGILSYRRQKTDQLLFVKWEKPMQDIADKYQNPHSPYLLPIILQPGSNERKQYLSAIHTLNHHLKIIGKRVASPVSLTSYVARHKWV